MKTLVISSQSKHARFEHPVERVRSRRAAPGLAWRSRLFVAALSASPAAQAQQSLFNVPSGEPAAVGRLFGQLQCNATADRGELNATADLGVTSFWEIGFNAARVPLWDRAPPSTIAPLDSAALFNTTLSAAATRWLRVSVGVQAGVALRGPMRDVAPVVDGWLIARAELIEQRFRWVFGAYAGTQSALGAGWPAGPMTGFEVVAIRERLHVMGDWVAGVNAASVAVLGLVVLLPAGVQISLGAQVPSPYSGNPFGGVLELTHAPEGERSAKGRGGQPTL